MSTQAAAPATPEPDAQAEPLSTPAASVTQGELGPLRVILMIALIWTIFQIANDRFLSAVNLTNLVLQITAVGTISVGVVLVLLLGEIDLSIGAVSGLTASIMAVLSVKHGWGPVPAIIVALAAGAAIGAFTGVVVTKFGVPSFVVTLAGLLGWQGAQLYVLGDTGTINLPDNTITDLTGTFFSDAAGWGIAIAMIVAYLGSGLYARRRRVAAGLPAAPLQGFLLRVGLAAAAIIGTTLVVNADRGLPLATVILVGFCAVFAFITERTRFGRHIFAVGGNAEASRRAGINVDGIRIAVFTIGAAMAAAGGILAASRLLAVNPSAGGGVGLLRAIAGPVTAGTSLFGGRGSVWSALLGALVIGSISNGMDLVALSSDVKYMITGAVLLIAVVLDSTTRSRRSTAAR
jgi:D-xylose transport system permease protein